MGPTIAVAARTTLLAALLLALSPTGVLAARSGHRAPRRARPGARVVGRDARTILRRGTVRVHLVGRRGLRLRVILTLSGTGTRRAGRRALAAGVPATTPRVARIGRRGGANAQLRLNPAGRRRLRLALATCRRVRVAIHLLGHRVHVDRHDRLGLGRGCARRPRPKHQLALPGTPAGGFSGLGTRGRAALFRVGAAVGDFSPPRAGQAPGGDPAACDPTATFNGARPFAFTEPYRDLSGEGHFQGPLDATTLTGFPPQPPGNPTTTPGDPYVDCNHNGRWEGNLLGGGGGTPRYYTTVADAVTARAMVVANGHRTIAVEVVDQEGLFNVYQQQIRDRVAADGYRLDGIFISATHDESAPDTLGLGGINSTTSGTNDYFLNYFIAKSAQAIEQAYRELRPATVRYTEVLEPSNLRQCWSSYPYVDDQHIPVLQAVGTDGRPIVTLASVSQHTETLGFNGGTPQLDAQKLWVSADWPSFFRTTLERHYGGVAIEMAGSVGSVESPQVYSSALSRTPQEYLDASHPAGCRTAFHVTGQKDAKDLKGAEHVPLGYTAETQAFGQQLAGPIIRALDSGSYSVSSANDIWGARANVCVPLENALFAAAGAAGVFAHRPAYTSDCAKAVPVGPTGASAGQSAQTQVAAFRIGDGEFISIPGEVFPFTYLRAFQGPQDMPTPQYGLAPWLIPHMHTPFRFIDGLGEDMIGYIFPRGNAAGIPTQANPNPSADDRFGCHHSDDSEAASSMSADLVGQGLVGLLDNQGGPPETIARGRYVLPDGSLSRDPLGGPELKCSVDNVFHPRGPAVGVELADGTVVHPAAWMSLSGLPQTGPDRDTRGYIDGAGHRVWLDVFPDLTPP